MKNRIKEIIESQGRSQAWVGRQIGKDNRSTINEWCSNHHQPSLFDSYRLAKILDVPMDELIAPEE